MACPALAEIELGTSWTAPGLWQPGGPSQPRRREVPATDQAIRASGNWIPQ